MIKDVINRLEEEIGELELLYSRPYENNHEYIEFSLKTIDYKDIVLRVNDGETNLLKFLLIYRIVKSTNSDLANKMSTLIIYDNEEVTSLFYKLKKHRIDLNKSIEDILNFRAHDLVKNIIDSLYKVVGDADTYSLINITVDELDSLIGESFNIENFNRGRYKIFLNLAEILIESNESIYNISQEEKALIKSTILSLALRKKENLYYITKEIIKEMTGFIKDRIELNSDRILEIVKEHKTYRGYALVNNYDADISILDENNQFYEILNMLLFIIPFLYCEVSKTEEDKIEYLELSIGADIQEQEIEFDDTKEYEVEDEKINENEINEETIIQEVQKFKNIIPSAKKMAERYYSRRRQIIDGQFKVILELFNNADLIRSVEVEFNLIEEVRDYLLEEGYKLEEKKDENRTIIIW